MDKILCPREPVCQGISEMICYQGSVPPFCCLLLPVDLSQTHLAFSNLAALWPCCYILFSLGLVFALLNLGSVCADEAISISFVRAVFLFTYAGWE
jgi:hypothetical protein